MKSRASRTKREHAGASPPARGAIPTPPPRRKWVFRLAALLSPLLLLVVCEFALRIAGYGYPTSFILRADQAGRKVLIENPRFGWRFFPPSVARSPLPLSLPAAKAPGTIRIFVLGESAAMGDPEPAYGVARQLERLLQARRPERRFEVVNVAMTAINSHTVREIARDCAGADGDLWIVYAGNNEVVGPFGAGTVFGRQAPGLAAVRATLLFQRTRLGQWMTARARTAPEPREWEGMEMFLDQQLRRGDSRLDKTTTHFGGNLRTVIRLGRRSGAKVLVTSVPVNLRDCPPFASLHRPDLDPAGKLEWEKWFAAGLAAEKAGRFEEALQAFASAARLDGEYAELAFWRARCELNLGATNTALAGFQLALDLDALRFRCDSRLGGVIRRAAALENVPLVDIAGECARLSPGHLPGAELFYDHVHLNFSGTYAAAKSIAEVAERELFGQGSPARAPWLTEAEVASRLAFTAYDRRRVGEEMRARLRQPPFALQSNFRERDEYWGRVLEQPDSRPGEVAGEYDFALALAPADWVLRANFGRFLETAGKAAEAAAQWREVLRLLPHGAEAYYHLGNLAYAAGGYPEASRLLREARTRQPEATEIRNALGLALAAEGRSDEAIREFQTALQLKPKFSAARVNLAVVLARRGQIPFAMEEYRKVLARDTNNTAARINLAKLLAGQGNKDEAIQWYEEALRISPENAVAHFDLANALGARGRHAEALAHYETAARLQPEFAEARYNLGLELARASRIDEALRELGEAVRLNPGLAEARYNYGIALAKARRFDEAMREFQAVLKLQPNHAAASDALKKAAALAGKR